MTYYKYFDIIISSKDIEKELTMTNNQFLFRFKTLDEKNAFKIEATKLNKSMNGLLGEIVTRYLEEKQKEVA